MTQQLSGRINLARMATATIAVGLVMVVGGKPSSVVTGQAVTSAAGGASFTIPYLANATKPADLDFTAAECDAASNGEQMACRFRQVFLTPSLIDATACVITTNGYERTFRRETPTHWVSAEAPVGVCGLMETTTLEDGGATRWTMTLRTAATRGEDLPECRVALPTPEVYDWRSTKRPLPCTSVQPGAIEH